MPSPEDAAARPAAPPNAIVGLVLNLLLPGAGFSYIGRWGWHLGWVVLMLALSAMGLILSRVIGLGLPIVLPFGGFLVMLVHYSRIYTQQEQGNFQPPLAAGVKVALIVAHVVGAALLASVMVPRLLATRMGTLDGAAGVVAVVVPASPLPSGGHSPESSGPDLPS
ncbi:hypothetical protein [Deinococcus sp.]|uniref:hypothetical protein n=1 Tax=Deinococcus sp. TaxID=47478 RepID=UPI002869C0DD|nr:hypothetical protein [Deinococcus sp.]